MAEVKYYYPIDKANIFINKICNKYDDSFQNIRVYGTDENPLFVAKDIYAILNEKDIKNPHIKKHLSEIIHDYDTYNSKYQELIKECPLMIYRESKLGKISFVKYKANVLTKYGMYRMMCSSKTKIAGVFRKFVYIVLDELEIKGEVKLIEAQEKLRNEIDFSHQKNLKKINALSIINADLSRDAQEVQRLKELIHPDHLGEFDPDSSGLNVYEKQFGKKSIVYLIRDEYVNSEILKLVVKKTTKKKCKLSKKNSNDVLDDITVQISDSDCENTNIYYNDEKSDSNALIISSPYQFETEEDASCSLELINYEEQIGIPFEHLTLEYLRSIGYDNELPLYLFISKLDAKPLKDNDNFKPISEVYFANNIHYDAFIKEIKKLKAYKNIPGIKKIFNDIYKLPYEYVLHTKNKILIEASLNIIELKPQKLRKIAKTDNDSKEKILEQSIREIETN